MDFFFFPPKLIPVRKIDQYESAEYEENRAVVKHNNWKKTALILIARDYHSDCAKENYFH